MVINLRLAVLSGGNITLFDKEITQSYSTGAVSVAMNNYNGGQLFVGGFGGLNIYYGNPPPARLPIDSNSSAGNVSASGVNNASTTAIGGFIGANGYDTGNPGGDITNSLSTGALNNTTSVTNGGTTYVGGFLGQQYSSTDPLSPPLVLTGNSYNTAGSGFDPAQAIGNISGPVPGVTPVCVGSSCGGNITPVVPNNNNGSISSIIKARRSTLATR